MPDDTDRVSAIATDEDLAAAAATTTAQGMVQRIADDPLLPARVAVRAALTVVEGLTPILLVLEPADRVEFVRRLEGIVKRLVG